MHLDQAAAVNQLAVAVTVAVQHQAAVANPLAATLAPQLQAVVANPLAAVVAVQHQTVVVMQVLAQSPRCTKLGLACWASSSRSVADAIHWPAIHADAQPHLVAAHVDRLQYRLQPYTATQHQWLQHQLLIQVLTFKAIDVSFKLPATFAKLTLTDLGSLQTR